MLYLMDLQRREYGPFDTLLKAFVAAKKLLANGHKRIACLNSKKEIAHVWQANPRT